MKVAKIVEAAKALALENLVVPETTVVTRDKHGHLQLWWDKTGSSTDPVTLANRMYDYLQLSKAGHWLVKEKDAQKVNCRSLGTDLGPSSPFCRKYKTLTRRVGSQFAYLDEKEFTESEFVSGILKEIFTGTYRPVTGAIAQPVGVAAFEVKPDPLAIKTRYEVDGLTFDTLESAQEHVKTAKIFSEFEKVEPGIEYHAFQNIIMDMITNPQKYANILQGK